MRECVVSALVLLCWLPASSQTRPSGWIVIQDAKAICKIAVPPEWASFGNNNGAAVFRDATTGIAVVTAQPGQEFKPLSPAILKTINVPKEKMFENTPTRIFYQDRTSHSREETSAYSSSVPAKDGTCSCHVVVQPSVEEEVAKKIALSLAPVEDKT
ncbi:MAG: hypothetical protein ABI806_07275 [Candidatus Solibacter sp.]